MTVVSQKTQFGMLQIEFNLISHVKIFLFALFHTKHFRNAGRAGSNILTLLHSIFLLVFFYVANCRLDMFCHGDRPIFTAAQLFTFSLLKNRQYLLIFLLQISPAAAARVADLSPAAARVADLSPADATRDCW
jgi:hypothetical protein